MSTNQFKVSIICRVLNWKNLTLIVIASFYIILFAVWFGYGRFPLTYGDDYFAFWSVGKIVDKIGYAQIYDLNTLKNTQIEGLRQLGLLDGITDSFYSPTPVPIFAFFVPILQLFSKLSPDQGYWIWSILNFACFISYIWFFLSKVTQNLDRQGDRQKLFTLALLSFPLFVTIGAGQINVFLMVCMGEFVRSTLAKKKFASGLWLGGFMLKPQLLILVIPILLICRYWKVISGLIISSGVILAISMLLSGRKGMEELLSLWLKYSEGIATNAVSCMVNWRMVGANLNAYAHTTFGLVVTTIGTGLTLLFVFLLVRQKPGLGTPKWVLAMLGVFSATTLVTWHSHYHMSLILIPLLIYVSINHLLPGRFFYLWVVVTPLLMILTLIISIFFPTLSSLHLSSYQGEVNAFSGLSLNLMLLLAAIRATKRLL